MVMELAEMIWGNSISRGKVAEIASMISCVKYWTRGGTRRLQLPRLAMRSRSSLPNPMRKLMDSKRCALEDDDDCDCGKLE